MNLTQAVDHVTVISLCQAQYITGTVKKAILNNVPVWANEDISSVDSLIKKADGVSYTVANTAKSKQMLLTAKLVASVVLD